MPEEPAVDKKPDAGPDQLRRRMAELEASLQRCQEERERLSALVADYDRAERESERFFEVAPEPLCIVGFDGYFKRLNPAWERILGYTRRELLSKPFVEFVHPEDREATLAEMQKLASGAVTLTFENRYLTRDGSYGWFLWYATPFPQEGVIYAAAREITERKQADEALQGSEQLLRQFVENTPAAVAMFDTRMRYLLVSKRWMQDYHLDDRDISGLSHYQVFPDVPERWKKAHRRALAGSVQRCEEDRFERSNGTVEWIRWELQPWRAGRGQIGGILMFTEVITERKRAEEALLSANERLETYSRVVDGSPDLIAVIDRGYGYQMINPTYVRMHGKPANEILGRSVAELHGEETFQNIIRPHLDRCLKGEQVRYEAWITYQAAGRRYVDVYYYPLRHGKRVEYVAVRVRDITDQRKAEEERERVLAELEAIITSIPDAVMVYSPEGRLLRMNAAAERLVGYTPDQRELPLEKQMALLRVETPEGTPFPVEERPFSRIVRGETVQGVLLVIHPPDGRTLWVSTSAAPLHTADGRLLGAVVVVTDVTALHELQEQREDLLHAVSHDLRSPLSVVQGQAQLLLKMLEKGCEPNRLRQSAEAIYTSAHRMNAMILDLVDAARMESHQLKLDLAPLDVSSFAMELKTRLVGTLDTNRIWVETPKEPTIVQVDPNRLERILTNLLSNALKYSQDRVLLRVERADGELQVSVIDWGQGIVPEDLPHIFERFHRPRKGRKAGGLGLGLHITRILVEAHGGRIWAESKPGRGSTFSFTLPA